MTDVQSASTRALVSELVARFLDKVLFRERRLLARDRRIAAVMNG